MQTKIDNHFPIKKKCKTPSVPPIPCQTSPQLPSWSRLDHDLSFRFYDDVFLGDSEMKSRWFSHVARCLRKINPKIISGNRRIGTIFGCQGTYTVKYFGKVSERKVWEWDAVPGLFRLKEYAERVLNQTFTICLIQYYKNGKICIPPHRDNVLKKKIFIAGLSLGQSRVLRLKAFDGNRDFETTLTDGSLYVLEPPTNDRWTHCIPADGTTDPRISITFRNE